MILWRFEVITYETPCMMMNLNSKNNFEAFKSYVLSNTLITVFQQDHFNV